MLKGFPGKLGDMLSKAQEMQAHVAKFQAELETFEAEARSAGGMVTAKVSGTMKLTALKIDPKIVSADNVEMLEDMVRTTINEALKTSRDFAKAEISKITGGLPIPGL